MLARQYTIDTDATRQELERLAKELERSGDAIAATRLRKLNAAVGNDPAASPQDWANCDLQMVINPTAIAEGIKGRAVPGRWVASLEWVRNSMVLFPLILTWLGISQATARYQELLTLHSDMAAQPFLYLWQQGFNHTLYPPLILSNLALMDCILLSIIFLLTVAVTWQYNLIATQSERNADQLRESLAHALGDAALCLAMEQRLRREQRPDNLADVSKYLFQFSQQFQKTTDQFLQELAEERNRRGDLSAFTTALEKITQDMLSAADSMRQTNADLTVTLKEILTPVREIPRLVAAAGQAITQLQTMVSSLGQLMADQARWRQELQDVLDNRLSQLIAEQKRATLELHSMLNAALQQMRTLLGQQISEQKNAAQELQNRLSALLSQMIAGQQQQGQTLQTMLATRLGDIASELSTSLGQLTTEQQQLGKRLVEAADTLEATATALGHVIQGVENATQEQTKMLAAMQLQQDAQRRLTDEMTAATAEIKNVLRSVREAGPELRSMSVDIMNFVRALRDIPVTLKNEMLDPLQHYSSAANNVATGSRILEKAALTLERAADKLDGRLGP